MISVVNKKDDRSRCRPGVYIGRPSPLGNPFLIGEDGTREEVIRKYDEWLGTKSANSEQANELCRLAQKWMTEGSLILICWCAPQACHGDVIKRRLEEMCPCMRHS